MSETSPLQIEVGRKIDAGLHLIGAVAVIVAAYYTGQTGNWESLSVASMGTALIVLFVTSE
ncbi:hypothetical protein [Halorussus salinisoli]|uniref:hypothetical protein n=1 Tax=Halorussus salinisoli TaxID=2558242 RepID=UPI0010C1D885|nr:hypothetical protein [Halorussus salinisoli]